MRAQIVSRVDQVSKSAMIYAAAQGQAEAVKLLLDRGVDVNRTMRMGSLH
jgi:ankyrin repeat protein